MPDFFALCTPPYLLKSVKLHVFQGIDCLFFLATILHATSEASRLGPGSNNMSKMNFSYASSKQPEPQVRSSLLTLGYVVLAACLTWMLIKPFIFA